MPGHLGAALDKRDALEPVQSGSAQPESFFDTPSAPKPVLPGGFGSYAQFSSSRAILPSFLSRRERGMIVARLCKLRFVYSQVENLRHFCSIS